MLKSSNSRLLQVAVTGIALFCCCSGEKADIRAQGGPIEKSSLDSGDQKSEIPANIAPVDYSISLEGYKASKLGKAVYDDDTALIQELVANGASIEECLTDETYVFDILYSAFVFNKTRIVRYSLRNKHYTDVNEVYTEEAQTPLTMACSLLDSSEALEIAHFLIELGADVDGGGESGGEQIKYPLIIAVSRNHIELTELLLGHGANKTVTDISGKMPLDIARQHGYAEIESLLTGNYGKHDTPRGLRDIGRGLYHNQENELLLKVKNRRLLHPSQISKPRADSIYLSKVFDETRQSEIPLKEVISIPTFHQINSSGSYFVDTARIYIYMANPHPVQFFVLHKRNDRFLDQEKNYLINNNQLYYCGSLIHGLNLRELSLIRFKKNDGNGFLEFITDQESIYHAQYPLDKERLSFLEGLSDNDKKAIIERYSLN